MPCRPWPCLALVTGLRAQQQPPTTDSPLSHARSGFDGKRFHFDEVGDFTLVGESDGWKVRFQGFVRGRVVTPALKGSAC